MLPGAWPWPPGTKKEWPLHAMACRWCVGGAWGVDINTPSAKAQVLETCSQHDTLQELAAHGMQKRQERRSAVQTHIV